jgi:Fes/CIP4, and EFC/F-BAR homology domain
MQVLLVFNLQIQTVIRERASLEANYAKTLLAIAKKTEKLNRQHIAAGVLGDNPSKLITDEALKRRYVHTQCSNFQY